MLGRERRVSGGVFDFLDGNDVHPALVDVVGQIPIRGVDDALLHLLDDLTVQHPELLG